MADGDHGDFEHEKTDEDGRRAQQDVAHKTDGTGESRAAPEFGKERAGEDAHRCADGDSDARDDQASDDGI